MSILKSCFCLSVITKNWTETFTYKQQCSVRWMFGFNFWWWDTNKSIGFTFSYLYWVGMKCVTFGQLARLSRLAKVLTFCVEFRELSHLSQAEKKITVVTRWATDKMTTIFTQNDNFDHFEWYRCQLVITFIFFSVWDKSRVKWDNSQNSTQKMRT